MNKRVGEFNECGSSNTGEQDQLKPILEWRMHEEVFERGFYVGVRMEEASQLAFSEVTNVASEFGSMGTTSVEKKVRTGGRQHSFDDTHE